MHDLFAGVTLASMNVPQVLGYARIAGMPVVTGLYTVLLPILFNPDLCNNIIRIELLQRTSQ